MAQHDYTIANQGFPAFRSDLNDALAAIVSNNSGATEPSTMFAHQIWVDTAADPSILKIRNADNDAWITIGTINQTGDTFTLTSAVSATTLNTSGAVVFNDAGADVDFRVEGDTNANLLFVDASTDRVGVGTSSPANLLQVAKSQTADTAVIVSNSGTLNASTSMSFVLAESTTPQGWFRRYRDGTGITEIGYTSSLTFSGDVTGTKTERMRLTSDGYLRMASGSGGIQFGGDTAAANALDDYEEGTWTPTVSQGWLSVTYNEQKARYTKIGNQVTAWFYIQFSGTNDAAQVRISGLPFTTPSDPNYTVGGALNYYNAPLNETTGVLPYPVVNSTQIQFFNDNDGALNVSSNGNASNSFFIGSVTYAAA